MVELFLVTMVTIALVLYGQARVTARGIRRNRAQQAPNPSSPATLEPHHRR